MTASHTAATPEAWAATNQRHVAAALAAVRTSLERHVSRLRGDQASEAGGEAQASGEAAPEGGGGGGAGGPRGAPMALDQLCATFRLSPFERDVLLLCAGVEMDASFASLCAAAQGDPQRPYATLGLALAALPGAHWSALAPASPLRRWRLVEVSGEHGLTASPLRVDERVLHFLAGVPQLDQRLAGIVEPVGATAVELASSQREIAQRIAALWSATSRRGEQPPVVQLCGDGTSDARAIAAAACQALGLRLCAMRADAIPTSPAEADALTRLWERESALSGSALLVECGELDGGDASRNAAVTRFVEHVRGGVLVGGRERRRIGQRSAVAFDVAKPSAAEQRAAWQRTLGASADRLNGQVESLVAQFNLSTDSIRGAAAAAIGVPPDADADFARVVWEACRAQARPRLDDLAQRIEPAAGWDDLVLPEAQRQILRDVAAHVRQRSTVYERWGFARQGSRGLGISALFAGASGTGKTMAAEVLANELRLDLYRIDLSSVVSKYIGETEKNLRRVFDAAEEGGAILLFDEADALFGKRSEVKDSHDRYANIEVSYLLQRMECYRGLAILTTNMRGALDPAFLRRIRFIVQFPFPDAAQRAEIWRRVFPRETPTEAIEAERLAQLNVAGGNIRSIALNAAFLAADAREPVRMTHLLRAARGEYAKLEKQLTEAETAGW